MGHRLLYSIPAPSTELNVGVENLLEAVMNYTATSPAKYGTSVETADA